MINRRVVISVLTIALSQPVFAQHDACRDAVRLIAKGDVEKGLATLNVEKGKMNSPSGEAEIEFVRAIAACRNRTPDQAIVHARHAVALGLPFGRIQAGPRDALAPLYGHKDFSVWAEGQREPLLHGPMLGSVTDTSARFWVRTTGEADVTVWVGEDGRDDVSMKALGHSSAARDYTAVISVDGLKPGRRYVYRLSLDDGSQSDPVAFRTFPQRGAAARFVMGFGGGAGYTPQNEGVWDTILARAPLVFLMLGDNVYIDDPEHALTQRYCYYRRQARPEWRRLAARTAMVSIYDDHDFGINDCVPGPEIETPTWKRAVWNVFRENWVNPSYGGGEQQPGCWYDFMVGDVHVIMLDCRYYRDLKGGSMLGPVQKAWLLETLKTSRGRFKVLASSVPWSPGVKPKSKDTWDGFAKEREEIFDWIGHHRVNGVMLMAADRHRSDLRRIKRPGAYDLYEVMSSRLTNFHTHPLMENAQGSEFVFGYNATCSFGVLDFDTTREDPEVTYRIVTSEGREVHARVFRLSELSVK